MSSHHKEKLFAFFLSFYCIYMRDGFKLDLLW